MTSSNTGRGEPLTIGECPDCGWADMRARWCLKGCRTSDPAALPGYQRGHDGRVATPLVPVRVFRERDVRPLYEALYRGAWTIGRRWMQRAVDAFPAPDDWSEPASVELPDRPEAGR